MTTSTRGWLGLVGLVVLGAGVAASPVPRTHPKAANMPAGRYVLAGGPEAATGQDLHEFMAAFRMKPGQFILSGGPSPTDPLTVDDDLELLQGDKKLFVDDDGRVSTDRRGKDPARYQGQPIILVLDPSKPLQVRVTDHHVTDAIVGELWLHRYDGAKVQLTKGVSQQSAATLPHVFFAEKFDLSRAYETPKVVKSDAVTELPDKPALLLARFRDRR
jgi:hypothetical protein